jgi:hypothetical protein
MLKRQTTTGDDQSIVARGLPCCVASCPYRPAMPWRRFHDVARSPARADRSGRGRALVMLASAEPSPASGSVLDGWRRGRAVGMDVVRGGLRGVPGRQLMPVRGTSADRTASLPRSCFAADHLATEMASWLGQHRTPTWSDRSAAVAAIDRRRAGGARVRRAGAGRGTVTESSHCRKQRTARAWLAVRCWVSS